MHLASNLALFKAVTDAERYRAAIENVQADHRAHRDCSQTTVTVLAEDATHTIGTIETTERPRMGIEAIEIARGGRNKVPTLCGGLGALCAANIHPTPS